MNQLTNYTVAAVKSFRGREGYGYSCNLIRKGKKVAEVVEAAQGGDLQFYWVDNKTSATVNKLNYKGEPHSYQGTVEEALFYADIIVLPNIPAGNGLPEMSTSAGIVIDDMVNDLLAVKKITSEMKKSMTVQTKEGQLLTWKISPTHTMDVLKYHALKNHPEAKILNDLPLEEIFQIYKKANVIS